MTADKNERGAFISTRERDDIQGGYQPQQPDDVVSLPPEKLDPPTAVSTLTVTNAYSTKTAPPSSGESGGNRS
jgi:hypothetical protein